MKKVLFILESFDIGGVEIVTLNLICELSRRYKGELLCAVAVEREDGGLAEKYKSACEVYVIDTINSSRCFNRIVEKYRPEIIVYTKGGLTGYINNNIRKSVRKNIAIQHVPINLPNQSILKNFLRMIGAAILYRRVDKVVCVSQGIKKNLMMFLGLKAERVLTIRNPVIGSSIYEASKESGCEYEKFFICVGRHHYQKGYDRLIDIATKVRKIVPDFKVVILGDGPNYDSLNKSIHDNNLESSIILHGPTSNPYKYMAKATAILLPSRWEGLPTVLVEASALKLPIIAYDCRYGPAEITENGKYGILIPDGNVNAFVNAIISIESGTMPLIPRIYEYEYEISATNYMKLFRE